MATHRAWTRRELLIVGSLTVLAAVLRFRALGRSGLTHFDEGVYALAGMWVLSPVGLGSLDPGLIPYAPPGFPILIGLAYVLFGVADVSALAVSAACGVVTVPVVAVLTRRALGPSSGVAAATFAATSLAHVAFSRKALTDVPFLLFWLVALVLGGRFLDRPGLARAMALGGAVGVAQLFKYNGWLSGVIVAVTAVVGFAADRRARAPRSVVRTFGWGALAALTATAVYWPWFWFVEWHGGYSALLRHQSGYLGGLSSWWPHWNQQLGQVVALSGGTWWVVGGWCLAWVSGTLRDSEQAGMILGGRGSAPKRLLVPVVGALALGMIPSLSWWLGLGFLLWFLRSDRASTRLVAVWWLVLSALTPWYHPYARLWLPLHACGWVVLGGVAALPGSVDETEIDQSSLSCRRPRGEAAWLFGPLLVSLVLGAGQIVVTRPSHLPARWVFEPAPSLREFATNHTEGLPAPLGGINQGRERPIRVLARRPLAYYLLLQGRHAFRIEPGPGPLLAPTEPGELAVIDDAVLGDDREGVLRTLRKRWETDRIFHEALDPVTLLDVRPKVIHQEDHDRENLVRVMSARSRP